MEIDSSKLDGDVQETAVTKPEQLKVRPSRATVKLLVHTRDMRRLLLGRPAGDGKPAIIGLYGFAERSRNIWEAANNSDPYAVWWLVRIEAAREIANRKIEVEKSTVNSAIESMTEFEIQFTSNESPESIELKFACPYAYQVARVLKSFDQLVIATSTAEQLGVTPSSSIQKNRFRCERAIRHLLASAHGFHSLGVKVTDIHQKTDLAAQASALMGEVPTDVLSGARRPALLLPRFDSPPISSAEE